jgi:sugar transferase (PEP-CTERM/EpsH1 system associated)
VGHAKPPLVAHIIYSLGTGGLENGLVNIINRTPPERYRHAIICLTSAQEFASRITAPDVQIVELHKQEGIDPSMYLRLLQILRQLRPAIIHSRNLAALDSQVVGLFLPGVKQVHGEHGRDIYDLDGSNWKYRMLRRSMRPVIDRYIAVSRDLEQWLLESIRVKPGSLRQIYNGVDRTSFKPAGAGRSELLPQGFLPSDAAVVLGTVGRLVEVKDQAMILRAVHLLVQQEPPLADIVRVVIVGDGPLRRQLQELTQELGLTEIVWFAGDRTDVPALLRTMDIFLLPSLAEGISNTILEAMATGLPVLATGTGGNPELVESGTNGYLVPVGDFSQLALRIRELVDAPDVRAKMGQKARSLIEERFDWDRTVNDYLAIYDDLLGIKTENAAAALKAARVDNMEAG